MVRSYPLHRCGLNVRMLGRVRKALFESGQECKLAITAVLIEILARTLKNLLREAIREKVTIPPPFTSSVITNTCHPSDLSSLQALHPLVHFRANPVVPQSQ